MMFSQLGQVRTGSLATSTTDEPVRSNDSKELAIMLLAALCSHDVGHIYYLWL